MRATVICGLRLFSSSAVHIPVKPPPTIATSTVISPFRLGALGRPSSWLSASVNHQDGSDGATVGWEGRSGMQSLSSGVAHPRLALRGKTGAENP